MSPPHRVAPSQPERPLVNELWLPYHPSFAVLELLDEKDSVYFRNFLTQRKWAELTPAAPRAKLTYREEHPPDSEIDDYVSLEPDWLYLSGHYGRTYAEALLKDGTTHELYALPGGLFNEPFHMNDWSRGWTSTIANGFYLQCESMQNTASFRRFMENKLEKLVGKILMADWMLPSPAIVKAHRAEGKASFEAWKKELLATHAKPLEDPEVRRAYVDQWARVWEQPAEDIEWSTGAQRTISGSRGFFFKHRWPSVKVVLLICCNALAWTKTMFARTFPNALVLGYQGPNPANATPHVARFLQNAFRGIKDPGDPRLMDPEHLAKAWMDVHYVSGMSSSENMGYMLPDGQVFGVEQDSRSIGADPMGNPDQIMFRSSREKGTRYPYEVFCAVSHKGREGYEFEPGVTPVEL